MSAKRRGGPSRLSTVNMTVDSGALNRFAADLESGIEKALNPAVSAGAEVIYELARDNASRLKKSGIGTGNLKNSIYRYFVEEESKPGIAATYHVSWRTAKGSGFARAPHAHLIEYGWIQKFQRFQDPKTGLWKTNKKKPIPPKQIPAMPFMRDAINRGTEPALAAMERVLMDKLESATNEP